jgi:hypothetical protein
MSPDMHRFVFLLLTGVAIHLAACINIADDLLPEPLQQESPFGAARQAGRIEADRLVECSGLEASPTQDDLLWAVNDGGNGPYLYALGQDGRDRGRVRVADAANRDWEGLETFMWQEQPMILVADFGDNDRQHDTHTIYAVPEPVVTAKRLPPHAVAETAWRIVFAYPDGRHDAEGIAVDTLRQRILVLTKRDHPPILFTLPVPDTRGRSTAVACQLAVLDRIPPPSTDDLVQPYGQFRSQPTAMDLSPDGLGMVVLTYKHAYLFTRPSGSSWAVVAGATPVPVPLPLPQDTRRLRQREAACYARDGRSLWVTSEGRNAGLYRLEQ